jgi:hypothetical protein
MTTNAHKNLPVLLGTVACFAILLSLFTGFEPAYAQSEGDDCYTCRNQNLCCCSGCQSGCNDCDTNDGGCDEPDLDCFYHHATSSCSCG